MDIETALLELTLHGYRVGRVESANPRVLWIAVKNSYVLWIEQTDNNQAAWFVQPSFIEPPITLPYRHGH